MCFDSLFMPLAGYEIEVACRGLADWEGIGKFTDIYVAAVQLLS